MVSQFTNHREWKAEAIRRGLSVANETGYTEDPNAECYEFAYKGKDAIGHCIGGPESELSAVLCDDIKAYHDYCNAEVA